MKKVAFVLLITAVVTYAQTPASPKAKSDAEKIASAQQAGPQFVTRNATVLDYPTGRQQWVDLYSGLSWSRPW
jgi:hypothetical protein